MKLETERIIIRAFEQADAEDLYEILGDEKVMEHCEPAYSLEKTKAFLDAFCIRRQGALAAAHKTGGKVIGYILFHETGEREYELGWFFNRQYWRQGYAYEACKAVRDYAFRTGKARKLFAETTDTVKSAGLMKKLGMTWEGTEPGQGQDEYGELQIYGLIIEDWRAQKE